MDQAKNGRKFTAPLGIVSVRRPPFGRDDGKKTARICADAFKSAVSMHESGFKHLLAGCGIEGRRAVVQQRSTMFLTDGFYSRVVVRNTRSAGELVVRVDGRRRRVQEHLRFVDGGGHGLDGGPYAGVIREGLLVSTDDLAYLQHVKDSLFCFNVRTKREPKQHAYHYFCSVA